jgi:aminoglycoside/choline kinase family phosphotransferase
MDVHSAQLEQLASSSALGISPKAELLAASGSDRLNYRITAGAGTYIGTFGPDIAENEAFAYFSKLFAQEGLNVPSIIAASTCGRYYIQQFMGSKCLLDIVTDTGCAETKKLELYKNAASKLVRFQKCGSKIDFSRCVAWPSFCRHQAMADLNYFKYYFLKLSGIKFPEYRLDTELRRLAADVAVKHGRLFMYRDFQARNIIIDGSGQLAFIDYQGGMEGPPGYDLASLLFQAKAGLSPSFREQVIEHYLSEAVAELGLSASEFRISFELISLVRIMQTIGAYGLRGKIEGKPHFIQSLAPALQNFSLLCSQPSISSRLPQLSSIASKIA